MSSKSILIILSCTVSKLVHFFETQCIWCKFLLLVKTCASKHDTCSRNLCKFLVQDSGACVTPISVDSDGSHYKYHHLTECIAFTGTSTLHDQMNTHINYIVKFLLTKFDSAFVKYSGVAYVLHI